MSDELKSNCENCGELEFNEEDRIWTEDECCYCRCGQKLKYMRQYTGEINSVGFKD